MDGSDLPTAAATSSATGVPPPPPAIAGDEDVAIGGSEAAAVGGGDGDRPERCEALAAAIAAALGGAIEEYDARAGVAARSQDELAAAVDRLNGELDKLLEDAPSPVIMQHAVRISSIRKRVSALNLLLKSIQRRIDNIDRILSAGVPSDNSPLVQLENQK